MQTKKRDVNVVISDTLNMTRDLSFAYCVELQAMLSVNLSPTPMEHRSWELCGFKIKGFRKPVKPDPHYLTGTCSFVPDEGTCDIGMKVVMNDNG